MAPIIYQNLSLIRQVISHCHCPYESSSQLSSPFSSWGYDLGWGCRMSMDVLLSSWTIFARGFPCTQCTWTSIAIHCHFNLGREHHFIIGTYHIHHWMILCSPSTGPLSLLAPPNGCRFQGRDTDLRLGTGLGFLMKRRDQRDQKSIFPRHALDDSISYANMH